MYASIRQYRSTDVPELGRRAQEGFVPIVREISGFSTWYLVDSGDGDFVTITIAEDEAGVEESVCKASEWVRENAVDLTEGLPTVTNGEVLAQA